MDALLEWIKVYGIFICCVYAQIILAWGRSRLILIAYYPVIFLSTMGIERVVNNFLKRPERSEFQFYKPLERYIVHSRDQMITNENIIIESGKA